MANKELPPRGFACYEAAKARIEREATSGVGQMLNILFAGFGLFSDFFGGKQMMAIMLAFIIILNAAVIWEWKARLRAASKRDIGI